MPHLRFPYPLASGVSPADVSVELVRNSEVAGEAEEQAAALLLFLAETVSEEVFKAFATHLLEMDKEHTQGGSQAIMDYMKGIKPLYDSYMDKSAEKQKQQKEDKNKN